MGSLRPAAIRRSLARAAKRTRAARPARAAGAHAIGPAKRTRAARPARLAGAARPARIACTRAATSPVAFALAIAAYIGAALAIEPWTGQGGELAIGAATWALLVAAVRALDRRERARVAAVVLIASCGEILGSLVLGLYAYRRGGIPAFVPPGHGLVYLAGVQLARSPLVRRHARAVTRAAMVAGAAWATLALGFAQRPDAVGALAMVAMLAFLARGREPVLFACMLLAVALLELYGTRMGTWGWAHTWPGTQVPMGNPPTGAAAGYVAFDALALRLGPRLERLAAEVGARRFAAVAPWRLRLATRTQSP